MTDPGLFGDPDRYLFAFDGDQALFVPMDRAAYARSIFLDRRIASPGGEPVAVPIAELVETADAAPVSGIGWIFHIAHCGSTLLARALDHPGRNLVLREPSPLRQLGVEAAGGKSAGWDARLRLAAAMLARRYPGETGVIVKANVPVNLIAHELLVLDPEAPAIFLYYPLDDYLLAVLRSPVHLNWVERVTTQIGAGLEPWCGSLDGLGVAERAGALWLAQLRLYADAMLRFDNARTLDAEQLFNVPRAALASAHAHFGVPLEPHALDDLVSGPLFSSYSKQPDKAFDNKARLARKAALRAALADDLTAARALVAARLAAHPLPERLPGALAGTVAPPLL